MCEEGRVLVCRRGGIVKHLLFLPSHQRPFNVTVTILSAAPRLVRSTISVRSGSYRRGLGIQEGRHPLLSREANILMLQRSSLRQLRLVHLVFNIVTRFQSFLHPPHVHPHFSSLFSHKSSLFFITQTLSPFPPVYLIISTLFFIILPSLHLSLN